MLAPLERSLDHRPQVGVQRSRTGGAGEAAVAARSGEYREIIAGGAAVAQDKYAGAVDIEERGDLRQHAFGQALH